MDYRGVFLVGIVLGAGALASATACHGPDPGAITFAERFGQSADSPGTSGTSGASGSSTDGGSIGSGADGGGPDPIFGVSVMKWEDPGNVANGADGAHAGTVEGKDCLVEGCHLGGGKPWAFGGTVYSAAQGGVTVPKAEVRIVGADGVEVGHAYTDANGNFWLPQLQAGGLPANSKVGVRKEGGSPRTMIAVLGVADNGCSANRANCHGTAGTGRVYAP